MRMAILGTHRDNLLIASQAVMIANRGVRNTINSFWSTSLVVAA